MDWAELLTYNTKRMEVKKEKRVSLRPLSATALNLDGLYTHLWPHKAFCRQVNRLKAIIMDYNNPWMGSKARNKDL